jgi:hypothetical protein
MGVCPEKNRNRASRSTVAVSGRKTYATPKASFIGRSPAGNDAAFHDENAGFSRAIKCARHRRSGCVNMTPKYYLGLPFRVLRENKRRWLKQ